VRDLRDASVFHTYEGAERIAEGLTGSVCPVEEEPDLFPEDIRKRARKGLREVWKNLT
jgi:hypothetical protein